MALPVMVLLIGIKDIHLYAYSWFRTLNCDSSSALLTKEKGTNQRWQQTIIRGGAVGS